MYKRVFDDNDKDKNVIQKNEKGHNDCANFNYEDLSDELEKLEEDNQIKLRQSFDNIISSKSGYFIHEYGELKTDEEQLFAANWHTTDSWRRHDLNTFFPWAFYLVREFYKMFHIKLKYYTIDKERCEEMVRKFCGCVYENFGNNGLGYTCKLLQNGRNKIKDRECFA